jgi:peptide/nickel transport system substrate-binding protein
MSTKRIVLLLTWALIVTFIASACGPIPTPAPATGPAPTTQPAPTSEAAAPAQSTEVAPTQAPTPEPRGTLKYAIYWEPPIKNPIYEPVSADMAWFFDPLVRIEYDGSILPRLAESWEHDEKGTVWTFHLRQNAVWHDGEPFTADDVIFTMEKIADPAIASPLLGYLQIAGKTIQVRKVDEYTVEFVLPQPYGPFLTNLSYVGIAPKHLLEGEANMETSDFNQQPIGTGPFKVSEVVPGDHWTLVANDDFYLGPPGLAGVFIRISGDSEAMVAALKTGELDITETEEIVHLDYFKQQGGFSIYTTTPGGTTLVFLNILKTPLFQDVRVRQAMAYAIDRQGIVDTVTYGYAKVAHSAIADKGLSEWASNPDVTRYNYDPAKASELLAEAGWTDTDGDGVLDKDGQPFHFTVTMQAGYATYENTVAAIQAYLKEAGIEMEIQALERSAFRELRGDPTRADKTDAMFSGAGVPFDPDEMSNVYHSSAYPDGGNLYGYANARVDELLDLGRVTVDREERRPLYMEAQQIVADEIPYIPIYYYWIGWVVNDRVKGLPAAEDLAGVDPTYYIGWFAERLSIEQ